MNKHLLKEAIRQRGGIRSFAEKMDWHRKKVQELVRGDFEPSRAEIVKIAKALHLGTWEFLEVFFPGLIDREGCWDA